jgi:hypothetical protein
MEFVHACAFCGWSRGSETPVLLPAGCPDCGCPADSLTRADAEQRAFAAELAAPPPALAPSRAVTAAIWAFALVFVVAAARVGYGLAEANGAIVAIGAAGFLLLPFVPERVGAAQARRAAS